MTIEEFSEYAARIHAAKIIVDRIQFLRERATQIEDNAKYPVIDCQATYARGAFGGEPIPLILNACLLIGLRRRADELESALLAMHIQPERPRSRRVPFTEADQDEANYVAQVEGEKTIEEEIEESDEIASRLMEEGKLIEAERERMRMRKRRMELGHMPI